MKSDHPLRIVIASSNAGKLAEFSSLLEGWNCEAVPQDRLGVEAPEETGSSFVENALLKAHAAAQQTRLPAIADDSGLEVDALDGEPGIFSARFAGADASDRDNNEKLLEALAGVPTQQRTARYRCALVYLRHWQDPNPVICQATWEGRIMEAPRGGGGFGYDPLFFVPDLGCTAAELDPEQKNRISHRGKALVALTAALEREFQ